MTARPQIDEQRILRAFRQFATGVVVAVAKRNGTDVIAARARAFNSLSLDPPLLLWSLDKAAACFADFRTTSSFAIHILADDQHALMRNVEAPAVPDLSGPEWSAHPALGLPIHGRCSAWFACEHVTYYDADDHGIFIGEIKDCAFNERRPLVHCGGEYLVPCEHTGTPSMSASAVTSTAPLAAPLAPPVPTGPQVGR